MLGFCCLGCLGSTWCAVGSGLAADISLGAVNGAAAVKFVRQMAAAAPPLRVLVLVIKALLKVGYIHLFHPFTPSGPSLFTASRREAVDHNCSGTTVMHLRSLETQKIVNGVGIWALLLVLLSVQLLHQRCRRCLHPTDIAVSEIDVVGEWLRPPS